MSLVRRPFALLLTVALLATVLVHLGQPPADAATHDVYVGERTVNGRTVITRRIEVPFTTIEHWEERILPEDSSMPGATNCAQYVVRKLDTEYLRNLHGSSWTGFQDGSHPSTIGVYSPNAPLSYGTRSVVDLAQLSASSGIAYGSGLGIVVRSFATTLRAGCSQYRADVETLSKPIVGTTQYLTDLDVNVTPVAGAEDRFRFSAQATHPIVPGITWSYLWEFEGGSPVSSTTPVEHDFVLGPGDAHHRRWRVSAVDENGAVHASVEGLAETADPILDGEWFWTDAASEGVKQEEVAPVRLRVDNSTGTELTDLQLVEATVQGSGDEPGEATLTKLTGARPGGDPPLNLPDSLAASGPGSVGFIDYDLEGVEPGEVTLRAEVRATNPAGESVLGTIEAVWDVRRTDLDVKITFDPPEQLQQDVDDPNADPEPVEMTATMTITNTSGDPLTGVVVEEFTVARAFGEQTLFLEQTGGYPVSNGGILLEQTGVDEPLEPTDLGDGESIELTADFVARDDGAVNFSLLALAANPAGATVTGFGEAQWVVQPEKYLEVTSRVLTPSEGLLPAGTDIVLTGRVINLSQTAEIEVGPLLPLPEGNTGLMSLHYGPGRAPDPQALAPLPELLLGPGDSEVFEVRVMTGYSDPRTVFETGAPDVAPTGGTRAYLTFDPWGIATEMDGTVRTVRTDPQSEEDRGVKLAVDHTRHQVSIDDSIALPETEWGLLAGDTTLGLARGLGNAAIGIVYGIYGRRHDALHDPAWNG